MDYIQNKLNQKDIKIAKSADKTNHSFLNDILDAPKAHERRMKFFENSANKIIGGRVSGLPISEEAEKKVIKEAAIEMSKVPTDRESYILNWQIVSGDGIPVKTSEPYTTEREMNNDWFQQLGAALRKAAESVLGQYEFKRHNETKRM